MNGCNDHAINLKKRITKIFTFFAKICVETKNNSEEDSESEAEDENNQMNATDQEVEITQVNEAEHEESHNITNLNKTTIRPKSDINKYDFVLFHKEDKDKAATDSRERVCRENQRLLSSFQIENLAMFFIKFRVKREIVNDLLYQKLIHSCYLFLIAFVKNNLQNQLKVHNNIEIFIRDIDKNPLICKLIYEMFKDNKRFLTLNVSKILRQIIVSVE